MIDALFWYTGLAVWVLIVLDCLLFVAVDALDRAVLRRGRAARR
jgi:hypothetical protein